MRKGHVDPAQAHKLQQRRPLARLAQVDPNGAAPATPATPPAGTPPADPGAPPATPPAATAPATPPPADQPNVAATPALTDEEMAKLAEDQAKSEEVITVTGSAIQRNETTTASPVSVVDREKIDAAGVTNVGDVLQKLPSQGNALNAQNNNGGDGSTRIDLRSLGDSRTLVLINGRRVVSSGLGADDSVDIGTIPIAIIDRVEVLKDGASAIYGSDAIAGVVNIITKQDYNGTEVNAYYGVSPHGDGVNYNLSFVTGQANKNGSIMFSAAYQNQSPVMAGDRKWSSTFSSYDYQTGQAALDGSVSTPGGRINTQGSVNPFSVPGCTTQFCTSNGMGGFRNFVSPTASSFGDSYNFQPANYLFTPSTRIDLWSQGHYNLTQNTNAFFEASFNDRSSAQQLAPLPFDAGEFGTPISADSVYNPIGAEIDDYTRRLTEFGPRTADQEVQTFRTVVGLNGKIPDDAPVLKNWHWEVSFDAGRTNSTNAAKGDLILDNLANALGPSFLDTTNNNTPTCGTPNAPIAGCVPLNLLTPGKITQAMINYLTFTGISSGFNDQRTTNASINGQVVKLPNGGDISAAVGGDYRHEQGGFTPDPLTSTGDTTGNVQQPTEGSYAAFEGFGEVSIVPVSGLDWAKWLEIDAAARAYHYNNFGGGGTYKVSGIWRTKGGLSLRGTYGTAFRAPSVSDLYAGNADSYVAVEDPCDTLPPSANGTPIQLDAAAQAQCKKQGVPTNSQFGTSQQRATVGGNSSLTPETAVIGTAGIVWEPLAGLDFTLDYWNIEINNAITALPVPTIFNNCYEAGLQSFCNLITRNPITHQIDHIVDTNLNVGTQTTSGLDFAASYTYKTSLGRFRHTLEGTYLFEYNLDSGLIGANGKDQIIHGRGNYDLGVNPDLKFNIFTTWEHPSGFGAGFNIRYVDSFAECDNDDCNDPTNGTRQVSKYINGDLFVDYSIKSRFGQTRLTVGVNNIADVTPPVIYNGPALNADESAYDFMGRYFYGRISQKF